MSELTKESQVAFWSAPEIRHELSGLVNEAQNLLRAQFRGSRVKQQHVINALILYVASLDTDARQGAIRAGLQRLEAVLDDPPPVPPDKGLVVLDDNAAERSPVKAGRNKKRTDRTR